MALDADDNVEEIIPHESAKIIRNAAAVNNEINKKLLKAIKKYKNLKKEEVAYVNIAALRLDLESIEKFINIIDNSELAVPFSKVIEKPAEKINFVDLFTKETGLERDFIKTISDCVHPGRGKFEVLFALLIKDALIPDKGDIQVTVNGKNYNIEVKDARGKISAIDGCGKIENIKGYTAHLKEKVEDFLNKLFDKLKPAGIKNNKNKKLGDEIIKNAKERFPVTTKNDAYISFNPKPKKPNISFNSFISEVKNLFFKTAQLIEGEDAELNEIKAFYNNVDNNIDKDFNEFLLDILNDIFNTVINGAYGGGDYKELINEYINSYYFNNQEPGVDIYGLSQVMGIKMLEKYKNNDGFRYFLVCNSGTDEAAIFDLEDFQENREKIFNLIEFLPPAITPGSARDAAFGVRLKK